MLYAFLRGMNLGGRRIKNPELCAAFEALGFADARAFLASGNLVFRAAEGPSRTAKALEAGLLRELGYPVTVFVRTPKQVASLAEAAPFADRPTPSGRGKPQVVFLQGKLSAAKAKAIHSLASDREWLAARSTEIFWYPHDGIAESSLNFTALEKITGVTTVRTQTTLQRMHHKFG